MRIEVLVHGDVAAELEANPRLPSEMQPGSNLKWLSSAWNGGEGLDACQVWLHALLPGNHLRTGWAAFARRLAQEEMDERIGLIKDPETILWAFSDAEYAGAVSLRQVGGAASFVANGIGDYSVLSSDEFARLASESVKMGRKGKGPIQSPHRPAHHSSLGGLRPKFLATFDNADGVWRQGRDGNLNTWIVKVEDDPRNLGEAGVESVCQKALSQAGIPAARTRTAMLGDWQCLLSRREDRQVIDRRVEPIHQEDMRQALGLLYVTDEFDLGPQWPDAYAVLRSQQSMKGGDECKALTRFLAAACSLGHGDLHWGNLGVHISAPGSGVKRLALAPAYDVSSACGTQYSQAMLTRIGGGLRFLEIRAKQWARHARECGLDEDETLETVADVCARMPDAIADARKLCRELDVNRDQSAVDKRVESVIAHAQGYGSIFSKSNDALARRRRDKPGLS